MHRVVAVETSLRRGWPLLLLLLVAAAALAAPDPTPIDLGDLGFDPNNPLASQASGINISGQIVGSSQVPGGIDHGFLWENSTLHDLGTPSGGHSRAAAINDAGTIVGYADSAPGSGLLRPWVYKNGQYTWLPAPSGLNAMATAIAPNGVVAGCLKNPNDVQWPFWTGVIWEPNANPPYKMTVLTGLRWDFGCRTSIDAAQRVAMGWRVRVAATNYQLCSRYCQIRGTDISGTGMWTGNDATSPMLWVGFAPVQGIELQPTFCKPWADGWGAAVNSYSQVAASGEGCPDTDGVFIYNFGYFWTPDSETLRLAPIHVINSPSWATYSRPISINDAAEVVGYSSLTPQVLHATLWRVHPSIDVMPLPPCRPRPCRVPPEVWYQPKRFLNDGIVSHQDFDATRLDPRFVTLGDGAGHSTKVAANPDGSLMTSIADVNDDGLPDLIVTFATTQLMEDGVLVPESTSLHLRAILPTGEAFHSAYPITLRFAESR